MKYSFAALAVAIAAVEASPFPQGVTQKISPTASAPSGCSTAYSGTFGIAVMNITAAGSQAPVATRPDGQPTAGSAVPVSTIADGQPQAPTQTIAPVGQISDGQIQATSMVTMAPVNQIGDGQIQQQVKTMAPVNQISDGQIQQQKSTASPVKQISDGQIQAPTATPVKQITDGQIQAPTATPVKQISDGQVQASTANAVKTIADGQPQAPTASAVKTIADGQPQAPTGTAVATRPDGQPTAAASQGSGTGSGTAYVACKASDSLQITLANGVLTDNQGRIGYIASNYQFQFDGPPQAGAIYTAGFSVCGNGSLALGGSAVFYQCLSGNFYNLYDRHWAPQCNPVNIQAVSLINC